MVIFAEVNTRQLCVQLKDLGKSLGDQPSGDLANIVSKTLALAPIHSFLPYVNEWIGFVLSNMKSHSTKCGSDQGKIKRDNE